MKRERWQQINEIYHDALELNSDRRATFLDEACAGDAELREEVESLTSSHDRAGSFIVEPALKVAARILAEQKATSLVGRALSHYRIESLIGVGGMGVVYIARDEKLDRRVAVKVLNEPFGQQESNLTRFLQEAKAASALNHPNILVIHEIGATDEASYIVSEFIEGRTLRDILSESPLQLPEVLDVSMQIASALRSAHEAGLVHRDVKPENIMLRPDGYLKILDFGLAKLLERTPTMVGLDRDSDKHETSKGIIQGTVSYMSPQQAQGEQADVRTDIFSLGVVMQEMLVGSTPFAGDSVSETFANLINTEAPPLSQFVAGLPASMQNIIAKSLQKNPDDRYQTMAELLADLEGVREQIRFEQRPERAIRSNNRRSAAVLVAAILGAIAGGLFFLTKDPAPFPHGETALRGTNDEEAYRLYLQGMYLCDQKNAAESRRAVEYLTKAVRLDPQYAKAWAGKAHAHRVVANRGRSANTEHEYRASMEATRRALALDRSLADAHSALCENKMFYEWDFDGAEQQCRQAIALDPNSFLAHQIYSWLLNGRARPEEAIAEIKTAIDLAPTSLFNQMSYGQSLYYARRYPEAVVQFERVLAMNPNFELIYPWLWQTLEVQGKDAEAFQCWMSYMTQQKKDEKSLQRFKSVYQTSGWHGILLEQVRMFENSEIVFFHLASLHARLGNRDKALEYLEKSYRRHELWITTMNVDPGLDSLRHDPRFHSLVARVRVQPLKNEQPHAAASHEASQGLERR